MAKAKGCKCWAIACWSIPGYLPSCCWYPITPGWREAIEVKQLAQGCKQTCQWWESNPWPLDYESKTLTTRPRCTSISEDVYCLFQNHSDGEESDREMNEEAFCPVQAESSDYDRCEYQWVVKFISLLWKGIEQHIKKLNYILPKTHEEIIGTCTCSFLHCPWSMLVAGWRNSVYF